MPRIGPSLLLALLAAGCGGAGDGLPRVAVSGRVTLDDAPLAEGSITFIPQGAGPTTGGTVRDGSFAIDQKDGPVPGAYRVEVRAVKATGKKVPDRDGEAGAMMDEMISLVPERYNTQSTLVADVQASGPNTFSYDLSSKPDRPTSKGKR